MPSLASIIAHARAGSLDRAWAMFTAAGYDTSEDPAALALQGRLLKDRARASSGEGLGLYAAAADSYARSAVLSGATYPLINAATLSLLAGNVAGSRQLAVDVLEHIDRHPDEPETPYYRAATRAEALLLLGRTDEARSCLVKAVALAPRAWEDHASTLRQFALILDALAQPADWLDGLRPPGSVHFGGHMSFRAGAAPAALINGISEVLRRERVGFGFGALAAGADILIAEALLARDAELHLVLSGGIEAFAARSVEPFGPDWRRRYDAVLDQAETVRVVAPLGRQPDQVTLAFADQIAMGAALRNARQLASQAQQLLIVGDEDDRASDRARALWLAGDAARRQHILIAAREPVARSEAPLASDGLRSLATLAIRVAAGGDEAIEPDRQLALIKAELDRGARPLVPPVFTGDSVIVGYDDVAAAARTAAHVTQAIGAQSLIGGHFGLTTLLRDPFSDADRIGGEMLHIAQAAAVSALPGAPCVSEDFALGLEVADADLLQSQLIGELAAPVDGVPIALHALQPGVRR
jgi:hypothetical protein